MTTLVVDSSVAPKWYVPEAHEREARRLLIPDYVLIAPSMLQVELTNIALQKVRRGQITVLESRRLAAAAWTDIPVRIVDSVPYLRAAYHLAELFHPSVYDCLYAAVGLALNCQVVTADRQFYDRLAGLFPQTMLWVEDIPELAA